MNEANILIYLATLMVSISLGLHSFKRRFLPIARPLIGFSGLMGMISFIRSIESLGLEMNQWSAQFLVDFNFFLFTFFFPLWAWMMIEFHLERRIKLTDKRLLIFYIHPIILYILISIDIFSTGFLNQESNSVLIATKERIGHYAIFREIYGVVLFILFIIAVPYLMIKKQQNSIWDIIQMVVYTLLPLVFFSLNYLGFIQLRFPAFILYLFWVSHQYRLLDVMPVALQSMIDKIDAGILVTNLQSTLVYANTYAIKLLRLPVSPQALEQHQQKIPPLLERYFDFSTPEKQQAQITMKSTTKKQKKRYIDATLQPIFNPKTNKHLGATVSLHDVTKRQQTELALQSLDRQKAKFFAGVSHEFRTPLTLSLGHLEDVLNHAEPIDAEELKTSLVCVKNNNKRLLNLVNQLLELSQSNVGTLPMQPVLLYLDTYLPSLIANFESLASKQNIRIRFLYDQQIQATDAFALYFDEASFDKIMLNLLSNALKSMTKGGEVSIELSSVDEHYIQLHVRDTGCGIPTHALPNVFEMFYSHQHHNTMWPKGTGVGLSLVKQLLNQHGADISVSSVEEKGTRFTLRFRKGYAHFPDDVVVQHQVATAPSEALDKNGKKMNTDLMMALDVKHETIDNTLTVKNIEKKNPSELSGKLVLLVDDNTEMRAYIRKHLAKHFRLIEAANGKEALELALQTTPDLVLSDVMMPKMNGYDLCKQLKKTLQTSHIPVLLLTAKSSQTEKLEGLALGADDYLSKPFDVKELTLRMNNLITARKAIQTFYQHNGLQQVIEHPQLPKREATFLDTLQRYVQDNISNTEIKVSDLAREVNMSERSLNRKLKVLTGETPKKMLLVIRLEYSKKLLQSTNETITQLSYKAGFTDASYFTRSFKAHYLVTPTAYRKSAQAN